ncbi:hypothetical protein PHPALM_36199 [Phytophthora palmivora]|uniref:MULE transposase domain-containing protein n=1 Tax=Phytophthora palmivora TaxID=4796 RepID=A0A2P4X0K9_9STRA|nr:hypothetical protein PHPALM_36199 [Phytophthora palmivora]
MVLQLFASKNEGSRVCCHLDSRGRSATLIQDSLLPVWECDGTRMKNPDYNGICLTLSGKDGSKQNVPFTFAYVHNEIIDNFACFLVNVK